MTLEDILRAPVVSEKGWRLQEEGKYVFRVHPNANKVQVKRAVESVFKVKVLNVSMMRMPEKPRRRKLYQRGEISAWKKAIVQLAQGQKIDVYR
ncbi:50S ribosomal protein L23 [Candidatus Acetothermia bacterium]|jgi:large subunit ribosomal protein L23|nr:50S ribosomal protein L23 [Candidatus Acetothermia bacterium]MCI2431139.1 50S ribosomal protein L23 [Candidatus Acetothermia bacterium]MCI2436029.1 50S ribosomal protein L23 [Candidatus Acetothermia bacterium]